MHHILCNPIYKTPIGTCCQKTTTCIYGVTGSNGSPTIQLQNLCIVLFFKAEKCYRFQFHIILLMREDTRYLRFTINSKGCHGIICDAVSY